MRSGVDHLESGEACRHHLRALRAAGVADSRREHKMVFYSFTEIGRQLLDAHLDLAEARQ